jgi:hypothetical protein
VTGTSSRLACDKAAQFRQEAGQRKSNWHMRVKIHKNRDKTEAQFYDIIVNRVRQKVSRT